MTGYLRSLTQVLQLATDFIIQLYLYMKDVSWFKPFSTQPTCVQLWPQNNNIYFPSKVIRTSTFTPYLNPNGTTSLLDSIIYMTVSN